MSAIITDQFRIFNASTFLTNFVGVGETNILYTFIGLSNSTNPESGGVSDWDTNVPTPIDNFEEENEYRPTILSLKRVNQSDVIRVIKKVKWELGRTYEMYKPNYSINSKSPVTDSTSLYDADYVVVNSNYRVYLCLHNGENPSNPSGQPSVDEPNFVDIEPQSAGSSGDGYVWKYLYTLTPQEIIRFDSIDYIPVPNNWGVSGESKDIKNNAVNGEIKIVTIKSSGVGYTPNRTWKNVPILGDGDGGKATILVGADGKVSNVEITNGGVNYTKASLNFYPEGPGTGSGEPLEGLTNTGIGTTAIAQFEVIIPPKGGHGYDIYRELGSYRVMIYSTFENSTDNPDFLTGNSFARIGILKNPTTYNSETELSTQSVLSGVGAIKFVGSGTTQTEYAPDSLIYQSVGVGSTAYGYVVSYDQTTGVLKYYQPVGLATAGYGYKINDFTSTPGSGGSLVIEGATVGSDLSISSNFTGVSTTINNINYNLGLSFENGIAPPDFNPLSGDIIYVDHRASITRSSTQTEDIRIIVEF